MFLLKNGNHKLSSSIAIWNLPRTTCIGKGECYNFCYAKKFESMPQSIHYKNFRLSLAKEQLFDKLISLEIQYKNYKKIRIHECGDFFNQEYLDKWIQVAKDNPRVLFLAYTKALILDFNNAPKNFIVFQSYGGKWDDMIDESRNTARVVLCNNDKRKNEYVCPYGQSDFTKCGEVCNYCFSKCNKAKHVAFVMHKRS